MLTVYGRNNSSNVQKVMWCIGELGLEHRRLDYGGAFGKTKDAAYLAMNPNALVPVIDHDGFVLWESNAIVRYLSEMHGAGTLWPTDRRVRADSDRWMDWQQTAVGPAMFAMFWGLYRTPPEQRDAAAIEASRKKTGEVLSILDKHLTNRPYVAGDRPTLGDIALGIFGYRWFNFPIERPEMKNLRAWYDRLTQRPAFKQHVMIPIT